MNMYSEFFLCLFFLVDDRHDDRFPVHDSSLRKHQVSPNSDERQNRMIARGLQSVRLSHPESDRDAQKITLRYGYTDYGGRVSKSGDRGGGE